MNATVVTIVIDIAGCIARIQSIVIMEEKVYNMEQGAIEVEEKKTAILPTSKFSSSLGQPKNLLKRSFPLYHDLIQ